MQNKKLESSTISKLNAVTAIEIIIGWLFYVYLLTIFQLNRVFLEFGTIIFLFLFLMSINFLLTLTYSLMVEHSAFNIIVKFGHIRTLRKAIEKEKNRAKIPFDEEYYKELSRADPLFILSVSFIVQQSAGVLLAFEILILLVTKAILAIFITIQRINKIENMIKENLTMTIALYIKIALNKKDKSLKKRAIKKILDLFDLEPLSILIIVVNTIYYALSAIQIEDYVLSTIIVLAVYGLYKACKYRKNEKEKERRNKKQESRKACQEELPEDPEEDWQYNPATPQEKLPSLIF